MCITYHLLRRCNAQETPNPPLPLVSQLPDVVESPRLSAQMNMFTVNLKCTPLQLLYRLQVGISAKQNSAWAPTTHSG
jgi:hypothetical protein